jgi:hypothetical protein
MTDSVRKLFDNFLFKVKATWLIEYINLKILEPLAEVDEKVADAVEHIPNGLTPMSESDWEETTPVDNHIYLTFPDEQVTQSES